MTRAEVMRLSPEGFAAFKASVAQLKAIFGRVVWCDCGWGFTTTNPLQRYCSDACQLRAWRRERKAPQ